MLHRIEADNGKFVALVNDNMLEMVNEAIREELEKVIPPENNMDKQIQIPPNYNYNYKYKYLRCSLFDDWDKTSNEGLGIED